MCAVRYRHPILLIVADPEGGANNRIHNSFSPYMVLTLPYMVKINCEYCFSPPPLDPLEVKAICSTHLST